MDKQKCLDEAIVKAGIDKEEFMQFLKVIRKNGDDLNVWTFDELQQKVEKYTSLQSPSKSAQSKDEEKSESEPIISQSPMQMLEGEQSDISKNEPVVLSLYKDEIPETIITNKVPDGDTNFDCTITEANVVDPGIFKSKYVAYTIVTPSKGYSTERKYNDFVAFRQEMVKSFPGYVITLVPVISGNLDSVSLQGNKDDLQLFLNDLARNPLIRGYELFIEFLSLPLKKWEEKSKSFSKSNAAKDIENFTTIEGEAKIRLDSSMKEYGYKLFASTNDLKDSFVELKSVYNSIVEDVEHLSASLDRASIIYEKLGGVYGSLLKPKYAEIFLYMSDGCSKLCKTYKEIHDEYQTRLVEFFNFYGNEVTAYEQLLKAKRTVGEQMIIAEKKLEKKKDQKFKLMNTATWELDPSALAKVDLLVADKALAFKEMLPKESEETRKIRMLYGYFANKVIDEFSRLLDKNEIVVKAKFEELAKIFAEKEDNLKSTWLEVMEDMKNAQENINKDNSQPDINLQQVKEESNESINKESKEVVIEKSSSDT